MKTETSEGGFSMIELLVTLAVLSLIMAFSYPHIIGMLTRIKIEGTARETVSLLRAARLQAVRRSCYGVVTIDPATKEIMAFADLDRDGVFDDGSDITISRVRLPKQLSFKDENGDIDFDSIEGLDANVDGALTLPSQEVIYRSDGSVLDTGAIRLADHRGNILEVNVDPAATGKVQIRKYNGTAYVTKGEGAREWIYQ
ncbi:MAG TPA: hypothetical protein DD490_20705 [Acidobacteria bacterium]|nr:hypothetical protein [Acidobacteriota bacterium]